MVTVNRSYSPAAELLGAATRLPSAPGTVNSLSSAGVPSTNQPTPAPSLSMYKPSACNSPNVSPGKSETYSGHSLSAANSASDNGQPSADD